MADVTKLQEAINKSIAALSELSSLLSDSPQPIAQPQAKFTGNELNEFTQIKEVLYSDKWPEAVNKNLICDPNSEKDKIERGRGIVELMIEEDLNGLKVLDFGCGEGQCAFVSTDYGTSLSVGYDIDKNDLWSNYQKPNLLMTTEWDQVVASGPYDTVILFDVIDHLKSESPELVMGKIHNVLKTGGKVYMRCHPWTSRHATHLYHDLNKAFVHLVFSKEELLELVPKSEFEEEALKVTKPILTYNEMSEKAGLKIINRRDITERVEPFFKIPLIANRIKKHTGFNDLPEFQMSLQFLDYVLTKE